MNFNLKKEPKLDVILELTYKSLKPKLDKLEEQVEEYNNLYWLDYHSRVEKLLGLPQKTYEAILHTRIFNTSNYQTSKVEVKNGWNFTEFRKLLRPKGGVVHDYFSYSHYSAHKYLFKWRAHKVAPILPQEELDRLDLLYGQSATRLYEEYLNTLLEADTLYADIYKVVMPLRTYKKLQEILPEAAVLIAKPEAPVKDLIPIQLIEDIQRRLK